MRAVVVVLGLVALSARGDEGEGNRFRARLVGGEEIPAIFTPGTDTGDIINFIREHVRKN
jgi:hypothetical protein